MNDRFYLSFGAAFARGRLPELVGLADEEAFVRGTELGLRTTKFKRTSELPRVRRVLSMLTGLAPASLLDVGSGRGTFLWPLLDAFPELPVTAIDRDEQRAGDLAAVTRGGIARLTAKRSDVERLEFPDGAFDGVTILEVLEHVLDPARAAAEALRVAERFVVATVPSKADENPEHLRLFDEKALRTVFASARNVQIAHVLNHFVILALK